MRKYFIRKYAKLVNKKMEDGNGIISRDDNEKLNGRNNAFYIFLWEKMGLNEDFFFFDDWTEVLFQTSIGENEHLKSLKGRRLNVLFWYSVAIMANYYFDFGKMVGYFYFFRNKFFFGLGVAIGYFLRWVYVPFMNLIVVPAIIIIVWIGAIASIILETIWDFLATMGSFLKDEFNRFK